MRKFLKYSVGFFALLVVVAAVLFFGFAADYAARSLNPVIARGPYNISERAQKLHARLFVADMHADSLLWGRDMLLDSADAQVDLPKLERGNVALQGFTIVTKTPRGMNIDENTGETDSIWLLAAAQRQPIENLSSLAKRALYQAARLHESADRSGGRLMIIKSKRDLARFKELRFTRAITAGWLGVEGAHALEGRIKNLQVFFDAGIRMMSPSHFFDTEMGGSAHGVEKHGLTEKGQEMIRSMEKLGMIVDVAHASPRTLDDVLAVSTKPILVSHTGVKGTCDNNRNLTDDQMRRIAATGGVIGIGYWDTAVCGDDAKAVAKAISYACKVVGADHVGLGSDFDGAVRVPFDTSGVALVTDALIAEGFSDEDIAKVMGGNVERVLSMNLPD